MLGCVAALALAGYPVVSYATSGSMAPAIRPGDGFLVDPFDRAPRVGDVVVYQSVLHPESITVHRVVGGDASGYATKGDANSATDQQVGEPPVTPERLRGRVLGPGPEGVLVLPGFGTPFIEAGALARTLNRATGAPAALIGLAAVGAGVASLLLPARAAPAGPRRPRSPRRARLAARLVRAMPRGLRGRHAAWAAAGLVVGGAWFAAAASVSEVQMSVVATPSPPSGQDRSVVPGGSVARQVEVTGIPLLPTVAMLEPETPGVDVPPGPFAIPAGGTARVSATEHAGPSEGLYDHAVRVWRYPAVVPGPVVAGLHRVAPGLPFAVPAGIVLALAAAAWRGLRQGALPLRRRARPRVAGGARP